MRLFTTDVAGRIGNDAHSRADRTLLFNRPPTPEEIAQAETEVRHLEGVVRHLRTPISVVQKLNEAVARLKQLRFARAFFQDKAPHSAKLAALNARNREFWEGKR